MKLDVNRSPLKRRMHFSWARSANKQKLLSRKCTRRCLYTKCDEFIKIWKGIETSVAIAREVETLAGGGRKCQLPVWALLITREISRSQLLGSFKVVVVLEEYSTAAFEIFFKKNFFFYKSSIHYKILGDFRKVFSLFWSSIKTFCNKLIFSSVLQMK